MFILMFITASETTLLGHVVTESREATAAELIPAQVVYISPHT